MQGGKGRETVAKSKMQNIGSLKNQTVILSKIWPTKGRG